MHRSRFDFEICPAETQAAASERLNSRLCAFELPWFGMGRWLEKYWQSSPSFRTREGKISCIVGSVGGPPTVGTNGDERDIPQSCIFHTCDAV
jgi:hypothetical protein